MTMIATMIAAITIIDGVGSVPGGVSVSEIPPGPSPWHSLRRSDS